MIYLGERGCIFRVLNASEYIYTDTCSRAGYSYKENCRYCDESRLGHTPHSPKECRKLGPGDVFDCYYIFGETVLHTVHGFGECPYLKGK